MRQSVLQTAQKARPRARLEHPRSAWRAAAPRGCHRWPTSRCGPDGKSAAAEVSDTCPLGAGGPRSHEFQRGTQRKAPARAGGWRAPPGRRQPFPLQAGAGRPDGDEEGMCASTFPALALTGNPTSRRAVDRSRLWRREEVRRAGQICRRPAGPAVGSMAPMGQPGTIRCPRAAPHRPPPHPLPHFLRPTSMRRADFSRPPSPPTRCATGHGPPPQTTLGFGAVRTRSRPAARPARGAGRGHQRVPNGGGARARAPASACGLLRVHTCGRGATVRRHGRLHSEHHARGHEAELVGASVSNTKAGRVGARPTTSGALASARSAAVPHPATVSTTIRTCTVYFSTYH